MLFETLYLLSKNSFLVLISVFPLFIYFYLISDSSKDSKNKEYLLTTRIKIKAFFSGLIAVVFIILVKSFLFPDFFNLKIKETWSLTIFISFIEAGLLEEICKNSCSYFFIKKFFQNESLYQKFSFGLLSGLVFGILENISYAFIVGSDLSFWDNSKMLLQRSYTSVIAHTFMNATFIYLILKRVPFFLAMFVVVFLHGVYDFLALPNSLLGLVLVRTWLLVAISYLVWMSKKSKIIY